MTAARLVRPIVFVVAAASASPAWAQVAAVEPGLFELGVGAMWLGHARVGAVDANEIAGAGTPVRLFSTSTDLASGAVIEGRVGVRLTRRLQVESTGSYGKLQLATTVTNDVETSAAITASERIQQITVDGALVWHVPIERLGTRTVPFVTGGVGYLRQLHERNVLIASGQVYDVGGGVKQLLISRARSRLKGIGARVDVRAVVRSKGVAIDNRAHVSPALAASVFVRF